VDSHNTKTEKLVTDKAANMDDYDESVRVVQLDLIESSDLAIEDDVNTGGDPYNSTGQHVIIKPKIDLED